jgi:hypothetical protein
MVNGVANFSSAPLVEVFDCHRTSNGFAPHSTLAQGAAHFASG